MFQENARRVGDYFKKELEKLEKHHWLIGDVRGIGLFLGIELVSDRKTLEPAAEAAALVIDL